ncbi:hypothetical protein [Leptospira phage LE3]|uniref:Uncharacterized protein n=1 Tax=Leptospira phage LE3 TaxID=2041382 RepID=A0A343LE58_9CAUD|nr:hypothetical protein HWB33_gp26 [Leptospira phage LE3]ATN94968.1 hypothetical protein [Leptospira phage LE3]
MTKFKILIHPADNVKKQKSQGAVNYTRLKKDSSNKERRYLCGVASGIMLDGHKERMTKEAIDDFVNQTSQKDILLIVNHGKDFTEDIGILEHSEILQNGDWYTEFRLYDEDDGMPQAKLDEANVVWKQSTGQAPYKHAKQFGFSIEGHVDKQNIKSASDGAIEIYKVDLDPGVTLVTKPAYHTSTATAIQKALHVEKTLSEEIEKRREKNRSYWELKWDISSSLDTAIEAILRSNLDIDTKRKAIDLEISSFKESMAKLLEGIEYNLKNDDAHEIAEEIYSNENLPGKEISESEDAERLEAGKNNEGQKDMKTKKNDEVKNSIQSAIASLQQIAQALEGEKEIDNLSPDQPKESTDDVTLKAQEEAKKKADEEAKKKSEDEKTELEKALEKVAKEAEGSMEDDPEEMLENVRPENELEERAKQMLLGVVKKSKAGQGEKQIVKAVEQLTKVVTHLTAKSMETEKAVGGLLEGLIGKEAFQTQPSQTQQVRKGMNGTLDQNALDMLTGLLQANGMTIQKSQGNDGIIGNGTLSENPNAMTQLFSHVVGR